MLSILSGEVAFSRGSIKGHRAASREGGDGARPPPVQLQTTPGKRVFTQRPDGSESGGRAANLISPEVLAQG